VKYKAKIIVIAGLLLCLFFLMAYSQKAQEGYFKKPEIKEALDGICIRDLHSHIGFLASDELQGRGTPSIYLDIAGRYIQSEFEKYGITPGGDEGRFNQIYDINMYPYKKENLNVSISIDNKERKLSEKEMIPLLMALVGTSVEVNGDIVFAGYGITAPEKDWDDYKDLDVSGKVVLVIEGAPWELDLDVPFGYDKLLGKWINAAQHGAVGFIYATPLLGKEEPMSVAFVKSLTGEVLMQRKSDNPQILWCVPGVVTSFEIADEIIGPANQGDLGSIIESMNREKKPLCFHVKQSTFSFKLDAAPKEAHASNVIGIVQGSDAKLKDEYIALTAHYDHLGVGHPVGEDSIYNGADDNASGTAGILEIAQAFSLLPEGMRPRRSLIFILVSGEESGLYGSAHYAENPTVPMNSIQANINLDMIGRCPENGVEIIAPGSEELANMMIEHAKILKLKTQPDQHPEMRLLYLSDQFPFVYNNIPAVFCFTGLHPDYHQPSDHIDKLNFKDMEKIVRAVFLTALQLANLEEIPSFKAPAYFVQH
jgi:hypothetical protein